MNHIYECELFKEGEQNKLPYEKNFNGNLREQLFVYKKFKQNLQKREQRIEIISNPCDLISPLLCSKG